MVPGPWMFAFLELASTYGLRSWPLRLPQSASWLRHCDIITICDGWRPRFRFTVQKPCDAWIRANPALERQTGRWNSLIETLPSSWGSTFSSCYADKKTSRNCSIVQATCLPSPALYSSDIPMVQSCRVVSLGFSQMFEGRRMEFLDPNPRYSCLFPTIQPGRRHLSILWDWGHMGMGQYL